MWTVLKGSHLGKVIDLGGGGAVSLMGMLGSDPW